MCYNCHHQLWSHFNDAKVGVNDCYWFHKVSQTGMVPGKKQDLRTLVLAGISSASLVIIVYQ